MSLGTHTRCAFFPQHVPDSNSLFSLVQQVALQRKLAQARKPAERVQVGYLVVPQIELHETPQAHESPESRRGELVSF